jgi:prepilin-type N-terminal cleavage/methylation domain-containing protein
MKHMLRWSRRSKIPIERRGFTIVEILVVIIVTAILATIVVVSYIGTQHRSSDAVVRQTVGDALKHLQLYNVFNKSYPANIANTEFAPPLSVAVALYTNASQTPVYSNLNDAQNAQLFLNSCNGFMPIVDGSTTYNTACVFSGNNLHVKGQISSNIVVNGPSFDQPDFALGCGSVCTAARDSIIATFAAQGGSFPIVVPKSGSSLPAPTLVSTGPATDFCLEGRSAQFADIIYHATATIDSIETGPCPPNASLHYP